MKIENKNHQEASTQINEQNKGKEALSCKELLRIKRTKAEAVKVLESTESHLLNEKFCQKPLSTFLGISKILKYPEVVSSVLDDKIAPSDVLSPDQEKKRNALQSAIHSHIEATLDTDGKSMPSKLKAKRKELRLEKQKKDQKECYRIQQIFKEKNVFGLDKFPWTTVAEKSPQARSSLAISRKVYERTSSAL